MNLTQIVIFFAGVLAGFLIMTIFNFKTKNKLKEYQRKLEKTSVQSDEGSSKVEVLEAKIKVLEKALESALENKNE
jgi:uncharacterized membrane protein YciS (DUF1049 family)